MTALLDRLRVLNPDRGPHTALTFAEAVLGLVVVFVAVAGWASLAWASGGDLTRTTLGLTMVAVIVVMVVIFRLFPPPPVVFDRGDIVVLASAIVAAVFFLPGAEYLFADKDPGSYATHAFAIARTGSTEIPDPFSMTFTERLASTNFGGRFPGYWYSPGDETASLPQFFHMWPSMLASAKLGFGTNGVYHLAPVLGVVSVATFTAAARRAFGLIVAAIAGGLMATNMLGVFFAKYPSTETFAQLLYGGAALLAISALRTRWAPAAVGAGMLASLAFLNRPDGVLILLLAVGALSLGIAARVDRRVLIGGAVGLALPWASIWYQAYDRNSIYARANDVPDLVVVLGLIVVTLAGGFVLRWLLPRILPYLVPRSDAAIQRLAVVTALVIGGTIAFLALRSRILGQVIVPRADGSPLYTLDELNLRRLFFFFNPAGLVLFWVGITVAVVVHRRINTWLLVGPGLILLPVYLWEARISPRLMWWGRRFVPTAVPIIVIIIAVGAAWLVIRRGYGERVGRAVAVLLLAVVVGAQLYQSAPLIGFREFQGSASFLEQVDDVAADEAAVFLWESPPPDNLLSPSRNASGPLWFVYDRPSSLLPPDVTQEQLDSVADAFPDHRVILLTHTLDLPMGVDRTRLQSIGLVASDVDQWAESLTTRPASANVWPLSMVVWELDIDR